MNSKKRPIIGVVCAQAADIEQREILQGIIVQAQELGMDTAVISNIYSPAETAEVLWCENKIYDLILSPELDGLILISEAIVNPDLQQCILERMEQQSDTPTVVIGTSLPDFTLPHFHFINTSDENDIMDITDHLIEVHGFSEIDILTGHDTLSASHLRVNGYRRALEEHGILFDKKRVHYGDFWMSSGKELAKRYISGELPYPHAIVCTNDYMAYGLLDEFLANRIPIPERVTIVGYEYIRERLFHAPILTTYRRNRKTIGKESVLQLYKRMHGEDFTQVVSPKGKLISGNTCTCGVCMEELHHELEAARIKKDYEFVNLFSQQEHRLTECRTIEEYVQVCHEFQFLVRNAWELRLCLSDNWYADREIPSDFLTSYSVIWKLPQRHLHRYELSESFADIPSVCYFNPLFFSNRMLGYAVVQYREPDTYDHIFRNWLKTIANGLALLRMKNDIQYLLQCQDLSETRDSLTGLFNEKGFQQAVSAFSPEDGRNYVILLLRIGILNSGISINRQEKEIAAIHAASEALVQNVGSDSICGRIANRLFAALVPVHEPAKELAAEMLCKSLMQHSKYTEAFGMDSFICSTVPYSTHTQYQEMIVTGTDLMEEQIKHFVKQRQHPYYKHLRTIRRRIYQQPEENLSAEDVCPSTGLSVGHFRVMYRECFGISFHQDCISARLLQAKYLLCRTQMSVTEVTQKCGYKEEKYFLRQFRMYTGLTPGEFRAMGRAN